MTKYIEDGNAIRITDDANLKVFDKLPVGTYIIKYSDFTGFYLERAKDFEMGKLYGDIQQRADRIIKTFHSRPNTTGVLLEGEKGTGKTLLAKLISHDLMKEGISTLLVNQPFAGEAFNKFVQTIEDPALIIFDEFEKVYGPSRTSRNDDSDEGFEVQEQLKKMAKDIQQQLLTLLDGVYPTKKLFILTTNNKNQIDSHMLNRPGRLYYAIDYHGLEEDFVREYCMDVLKDKKHVESVVQIASLFDVFSFDMLKGLVEEMNRYGEKAQQAIRWMNIRIQTAEAYYDIEAYDKNGKKLDIAQNEHIWANPAKPFSVTMFKSAEGKKAYHEGKATDDRPKNVLVKPDNCTGLDNGVYTFTFDKFSLKLSKHRNEDYSNRWMGWECA